ncbi:MAG: RNA polymerase sigma-70 factor [Bacteroidales bacterium]|nr:RNA polymerase sigma-70 factor [Bacteroidales bacterium]
MVKPDSIEWQMLQRGDEQAWQDLFRQHYAVLCHFALQFVHDRFTAEALVGDVFYTLWERRTGIEIRGSVRQYLLKAVRNRCLNYLKSFDTRQFQHFSSMNQSELDQIIQEDYEGRLLDLEEEVEKAVSSLPEQSRRVFEKSREENLKYVEIAQDLGVSVNTVKYHMKKALSLLRDYLAKYLVFLLPFSIFVLSLL